MKLFGVTASQFVRIGLIAAVFIILLKLAAAKVPVPGLQSAVGVI